MSSVISILLTILASLSVFGLVILIHEAGHFTLAKLNNIKIIEFSVGMGPRLCGFTKGETKYNLRALPIGGYVSMEGEDEESDDERSFMKATPLRRMGVIVAGALMNFVLGFIVLFCITLNDDLVATRTVHSFIEYSTTQASGLMVGDEIIAVNGRKIYIADDLMYEIVRIQDFNADITVIRDGHKVQLNDVRFQQQTYEDGSIGIKQDFIIVGQDNNIWRSFSYAGTWTLSLTRQVFLTLVDLISGRVAINQMSGPVGIVSTINKAIHISFSTLMYIMAIISINLGVVNMLPIPALDGGKFLLYLIESTTGFKLDKKIEIVITVIGFIFLLGFMLFITFNDVSRLFFGG